MDAAQLINQGIDHHKAGRYREAELAYRQILTAQPDNPDALHLLGMIAHSVGQRDAAMQLVARAITVSPGRAEFYGSMGLLLGEAGRIDDAISSYRRAISLKPNLAQAYNNLGNALAQKGIFDEAIAYLRQAMAIEPRYPDPPYNLGNVFSTAGRLPEAIAAFKQALAVQPRWPQALNNLGVAYKHAGQADAAVACFEKTLEMAADYVPALNNLGDILGELGQFDRAIAASRLAIQVRPNLPEAHNNLGNALCNQSRFDDAMASYHEALRLRPNYVEAQGNLGHVYFAQGQFDQAMEQFRKAAAMNPKYASAHWNMGLVHLMKGEYAQGWPEFEWRWLVPNIRLYGRRYSQPLWDGSDLAGRRILLHADQGIGDTIFFLRYAPLVALRGGTVIVAAQAELRPLIQSMAGVSEAISINDAPADVNVRSALMGLPRIFATTLETIPAEPYLFADDAAAAAWKSRMPEDGRKKVGLAWVNRPDPPDRCPKAEEFAPLAEVKGAWFTSLQKDCMGTTLPENLQITDWTSELNNLADTAALIANLDLVITVDTAVAHLAGAMGKPTWLILKHVPDWRWMMDRADSPWYPSMRLFRQPAIGDWKTPIEQVCKALAGE